MWKRTLSTYMYPKETLYCCFLGRSCLKKTRILNFFWSAFTVTKRGCQMYLREIKIRLWMLKKGMDTFPYDLPAVIHSCFITP